MADAVSVSANRKIGWSWTKFLCLGVGIGGIAAVALLLNRETYAIGDDYTTYTLYFGLYQRGFFANLVHYLGSSSAAGRPLAILVDLASLSSINSFSELYLVRHAHLACLIVIFVLLGAIAEKAGLKTIPAYLVAFSAFLQLGVWHLFMVTYGTGILAGMISGLLASHMTMRPSLTARQWIIFALLAAWPIFSYQPSWPLILLGVNARLFGLLIGNGRNRASSDLSDVTETIKVYFTGFAIVIGLFVINYLVARFGYQTLRLASGAGLVDNVIYIGTYFLQMTIFPWPFFWFGDNASVLLASRITYLAFVVVASAILVRPFLRASVSDTLSLLGLRGCVVILLAATALLPLSLGMFLFTDLALAYRRVTFASIFFWFTLLLILFLASSRPRKEFDAAIQIGCAAAILYVYIDVATVMDKGVQQVAAREWRAATCAAKSVTLTGRTAVINRPSALSAVPRPFPNSFANDEIQVRTMTYFSGAMLIWLSQREANPTAKITSPWTTTFSDDAPLSSWDIAYAKCASEHEK